MNRYHRYLNIDSYRPTIDFSKIETGDKKWVEFHKTLELNELNNPDFVNWLHSLGMTSYWIELFYTPPGEDGCIHSDNIEWKDWAKIVFQYGAIGSTMRWWTSEKTYNISTSLNQVSENQISEVKEFDIGDRTDDHYHGQVMFSHEKDAILQYEAEINNASLVNVGPLHSSHNPTEDKRFVITVALFDFEGRRILWDEAVEKLSSYIQ
jgi:hypothetical protein